MKFTLITPTIGRDSLIRACRSLDLQSHTDWEHLVMLDGDRWPEPLLRQIAHPRRTLLQTGARSNDFGNTPRRLAHAHATGWYTIYLDDDVYLAQTDVLARLDAELMAANLPPWAIMPRYQEQNLRRVEPIACRIDTANMVISTAQARWLDGREYHADGLLAESLAARMPNYARLSTPAIKYETNQRGEFDQRPAVVTAVSENYWPWFPHWINALRQQHDWPVYVVDCGLTAAQQSEVVARGLCLLRPAPAGADGWEQRCMSGLLPAFDLVAPRVLWLDVDTLVLQSLHSLWIEHPQPFRVFADTFNPRDVPNQPGFYENVLRLTRPIAPCIPNSGVVAWETAKCRELLDAYRYALTLGCASFGLAQQFRFADQGALIWAMQATGRANAVIDDPRWNQPANGLDHRQMRNRVAYPNVPELVGRVTADHPDARIVHWMGNIKPWSNWGQA